MKHLIFISNMLNWGQMVIIYLGVISTTAMYITVLDKNRAKKNKWRISEAMLIIVSMLGGSVSMLITMKIIRHKTKHKKFMIGIPIIIALQVAIVLYFIYKHKFS